MNNDPIWPDHPYVRASCVCPLCQGDKPTGNLACWTCYRAFDMRNGNQRAENTIAIAEAKLSTPPPAQLTLL